MSKSDQEPNNAIVKQKRGRPVGDHDSKRNELVNAVIELLSEKGCQGISFRKVAAKVGCTTGAVTYYFENKEAMLIAATDYLFGQFELILAGENGDVKIVLDNWLNWSLSESSEVAPIVAELFVYARQDPNYAQHLQKWYVRMRSSLTATLEQGQARGEIRTDIDAAFLADQLSALVDGWMIISPIEPQRYDPQQTKAFFDITLKLLAP